MVDEPLQNEVSPPPPTSRASRPLDRFSTRILCLVFLSTFVTAGVVSWISIDAVRSQLRRQLDARYRALLEQRGADIDAYLSATRIHLGGALADGAVLEKLEDEAPTSQQILEDILSSHAPFSGIAVVRSNGGVIARAGAVSAGAAAALAAAPTQPDRPGLPAAFVIGGAIPTLGTWIGGETTEGGPGSPRVAAIHRLEPLRALLQLGPDDGPGRLVLADRAGHGLVWTEGAHEAPALPVQTLLAGGAGRIGQFTSANGEEMFGSVRALRSASVYLAVETPVDIVYAPLRSVVERIILSDLAIVLLFSLLAYRITTAIMRPVEALSEGAARVSRGDVLHDIPMPRSNDEIGRLARSFNDMMHRLRSSQDEIEQDKLRLTEQNEELQRANEVLAQLSITDGLTRLHNHRFFQDHLTREIKRVDRTGEPLAMLLMDLDDFKRLNDRHGHAAGDEVLMNIAGRLNENIRESDLLARYGGEEFVVLAPNTDPDGALALAEKIRMSVESMPQIVDDSMRPIRVTISCGVAQYTGDRKSFFQAADRALYRAKAEGKNCVVVASDEF